MKRVRKPLWEAEGAYRHHESPEAQSPELESNQTVPGALSEERGAALHAEMLPFREKTGHRKTKIA